MEILALGISWYGRHATMCVYSVLSVHSWHNTVILDLIILRIHLHIHCIDSQLHRPSQAKNPAWKKNKLKSSTLTGKRVYLVVHPCWMHITRRLFCILFTRMRKMTTKRTRYKRKTHVWSPRSADQVGGPLTPDLQLSIQAAPPLKPIPPHTFYRIKIPATARALRALYSTPAAYRARTCLLTARLLDTVSY